MRADGGDGRTNGNGQRREADVGVDTMGQVRAERAASESARWALAGGGRNGAAAVARSLDVSPARVRHLRTDEAHRSPVAETCHLVMTVEEPDIASRTLEVVEQAWERRGMLRAPTPALLSRLTELWERGHEASSRERVAWSRYLAGGDQREWRQAMREYCGIQRVSGELWEELEARGGDVQRILLGLDAGKKGGGRR